MHVGIISSLHNHPTQMSETNVMYFLCYVFFNTHQLNISIQEHLDMKVVSVSTKAKFSNLDWPMSPSLGQTTIREWETMEVIEQSPKFLQRKPGKVIIFQTEITCVDEGSVLLVQCLPSRHEALGSMLSAGEGASRSGSAHLQSWHLGGGTRKIRIWKPYSLHREFKASLGYMRPCFKNKNQL